MWAICGLLAGWCSEGYILRITIEGRAGLERVLGGGSLYRNGGLAKVRLLRGGSRGPAAPPSLGGKVEGQGMKILIGRVSGKWAADLGICRVPSGIFLCFFSFRFSPLSLPPFSLFLQPGNLEVRLRHGKKRDALVTYWLPGRDG
jgi:hypothetical protein